MGLLGCYEFIKYALACVNFIFWVVGVAAVALAIWMLVGGTFLTSLAEEQHNLNAGIYILLSIGILMLIVSVLGLLGVLRGYKCTLVAFFSCLLVVIVMQIAAGAWLFANINRLEDLVESSVISSIKYKYGEDSAHTNIVDTFQSDLRCCGAIGPADWIGSKYATKDPSSPVSLTVSEDANNEYKVPKSCCKGGSSDACKAGRKIKVAGVVRSSIYSEGCINKLMDALNSQRNVVISVAAVIGLLELLGLIFSVMLCCTTNSPDTHKA